MGSSPAQVQVTARHILRCTNEDAVAALESPFKLGPINHLVFPFVPIEAVFVYRKPTSTSDTELICVPQLKRALSRLLDYYPHLTGRLQFDPEERTPEITRLGTGAELLEAQSSIRLDDITSSGRAAGRILIPSLPDCGGGLLPPFDRSIEGVCRDPVLAVKHTRFACGGVSLGIRLHHIVCDAHGYFQLVCDLAEIYRGLRHSSQPDLSTPPEIRSYLRGPNALPPEERRDALKFEPSVFYVDGTRKEDLKAPTPDAEAAPPVLGRILRFTGHDLKALKDLATDPNGDGWVSTFEALSAYLYQTAYRARVQLLKTRGVPESTAASQISRGFWASIDARSRLNLPDHYFPNAVYCPYTYSPHKLLADGPLWQVAKSLHDLIRSVEPHQMDMTNRWVAAQPDKSRIRLDYSFSNGSFTVSQWAKFDMYLGVDFDVDENGKPIPPVLVPPPFTEVSRVDGLAMILSTEEQFHRAMQGGSASSSEPCAMEVNLTLSEPL